MKLHECSHVHFIQAIKGRSAKKILSTHGRPTVRFKEIKAIYELENAMKLGSCSAFKQQEYGFMDLPHTPSRAHTETHTAERTVSDEADIYGLDKYDAEGITKIDTDEVSFICMTLKELKWRCKTKKRKFQKLYDVKQESGTSSVDALSGSGRNDNVHLKEEEDLEVPLSSLKLKILKKSKRRDISRANLASVSAEALSLSSQISLQNTGGHGSINIKTEILEADALGSKNVYVMEGSAVDSCVEMRSCREYLNGTPERVGRAELDSEEPISCIEATACYLNEVSYEYMELEKSTISSIPTEKFEEINNPGIAGTTCHQPLQSLASEHLKESHPIYSLPPSSLPETSSVTNDPGCETCSSYTSDSSKQEQMPCPTKSTLIQMHEMVIDDSLQYGELNNGVPASIHNIYGENCIKRTCLDLKHIIMNCNTEELGIDTEVSGTLQCEYSNNGGNGSVFYIDDEGVINEVHVNYTEITDTWQCEEPNNGGNGSVFYMDNKGVVHETHITDTLRYVEPNNGGMGSIFCIDNKGIEHEAHIRDRETRNTLELEPNNSNSESGFGIDNEGDIKKDTESKFDLLPFSQNAYLCFSPQKGSDVLANDSSGTPGQEESSETINQLTFASVESGMGSIYCIDNEGIVHEAHIYDTEITNTLQVEPGTESGFDIDDEGDVKKDTESNFDLLPFSQNSYPCFSPQKGSDVLADDSSGIPGRKESSQTTNQLAFACVDGKEKCLEGIDSSSSTDYVQKIETPPRRIFSTRKVISPTSQEKLCQAIDAEALYANTEPSSCKDKLCFELQKDSSSRSDHDGTIGHEQKTKILKNNKGSLQEVRKGILKDPKVTSAIPYADNEFSSIYSHTQKATKFLQMQMHAIENLALKLTKELKVMTDIVEETSCSEMSPSTSSKYTADEIRMAVENAVGVQETTKKWLFIMARDCNRFCKIMKSTEKKAAHAPGPIHHKPKKKIMFADEAGGTLCHVKVFNNPHASPFESEIQEANK